MRRWPVLLPCFVAFALHARDVPASGREGAAAADAPASVAATGTEASHPSPFHDPADGGFDISSWLLEHHGFLPVPIIITEPAIGYGGGLALAFFHRPAGQPATRIGPDGKPRMIVPDLYGAMAMKTENGSQAFGGGALMHFREDTWRYTGALAKADMNIDFYTSGRLLPPREVAVNMRGMVSFQQVSRRIGRQDMFVSARWIYMDLEPRLENSADRPYFTDLDFEEVGSALGLVFEYDTRDSPFTPSRGYLFRGQADFYLPRIGSDVRFQNYRVHGYGYWPVGDHWVLGGRADLRNARGDVPFYQLPYIDLRGVPLARYQDDRTGVLETELRWNLTVRWALVGFAGAGRAWGERASFGDAFTAVSKGLGVRYLIAHQLDLYVGADYAWGPEDRTVIVQVGSAWR